MEILDSEGRLFSVVNIIDALVVLVVVAILISGIVFVSGAGDEQEQEQEQEQELGTAYATLDLGKQSVSEAQTIDVNDTYSPGTANNLTMTDIYRAPQGSGTRVVVRVALRGPIDSSDTISYGENPPRIGRQLTISTGEYEVSGQIVARGNNPSLNLIDSRVLLVTTLPIEDATTITSDDTLTVGAQKVGTVESVVVTPTDDPTQAQVYFDLSLQTIRLGNTPQFGGSSLQQGADLAVRTTEYDLTGKVLQVGGSGQNTESSFTATETRQVLVSTTVPIEDARQISTGDSSTIAEREVGTVESVSIYPTDSSEQVQAVVGLTLQTILLDGTSQFGGTRLDTGATIPISTPDYDFAGEVLRLDTVKERGVERTRTVTLTLEDVPAEKADRIRKGQADRLANTTFARLLKVEQQPSQIVAITDSGEAVLTDHPLNKDLTITAELTVRETANSVRFKRRPIQSGSTISLSLNTTTIQPEVSSL